MERFEIQEKKETYTCLFFIDKVCVSRCVIDVVDNIWTISSWYTTKGYGNKGYGTKTMQYLLKYIFAINGAPNRIEYIWNGSNLYVFDWLDSNFGAISKCPIAIQKTQSDDDWDSHIYYLNTNKFMRYFNLVA